MRLVAYASACMISLQRLFGREDKFFTLLLASAGNVHESVVLLNHLLRHERQHTLEEYTDLRKRHKKTTSELSKLLVRTFITVLEREDIEALSSTLYKIPKTVEKFAERYEISRERLLTIDFSEHAALLATAASTVEELVRTLSKGMDIVRVKILNDRIQQVEGKADALMIERLRDLYSGRHDTLDVIIISKLYDLLESVVDRCRDVGNVVAQIAYKNS